MPQDDIISAERLAESRLAALLNATPDGIVLIDAYGRIEAFSPGAERIFGYSAPEIIGQNVSRLMPAPFRQAHDGYIARYQRTGEARFMLAPRDVEARRKDGSTFPAEVSVGRVDSEPMPSFIGIVRDNSARRAAEDHLRRVEANLSTAQALAHVGSFEGRWPEDGEYFWSDEVFRIVGLEPGSAVPPPAEFAARFVHPDDRAQVVAAFAAAMERTSGGGELEYRIVRPDGELRNMHTIFQIIEDPRTGALRMQGTMLDVTQRREAENALRHERDRAQRYLDVVDVLIIVVDRNGRIQLVNRMAAELLRYTEAELIGRDFIATCQSAADAGRSRELFNRAMQGDEQGFELLEGPVLTRDGHTRRVRWRNQLLRNDVGQITGVLSAGEDVTEQRATEAQLRQAEEELRLIFRRAPVGMTTLAAAHEVDGHYLSVNEALCSMLGYSEGELLSMSVRDITHPDDMDVTLQNFRELLSGSDAVRYQKRYFRKDGSIVHALVHHSLVSDALGRPIIIISQILDRSDVVEAELEARQQRERLAHVARLGTLGEMAAGIAHELNQPLTAIANYTQACQRLIGAGAMDAAELGDVLGRVTAQARRAGDVIHRLRAFVRRHTTERRARDVNELIYEILPLVELDARAHEVDLQLELDESVPSVQADGVQLQQVLLNLTRNAVEAMSSSGGHGQGRRLVIRTGVRNEDEIEVAVQDSGEGVPAALRAQLFEPFFTTKAEGMGLGLSLSRSICESHGGTLRYDAAEHGGSIFRIWLPTAPEEE